MSEQMRPTFTHGGWFDETGFKAALQRYANARAELNRSLRSPTQDTADERPPKYESDPVYLREVLARIENKPGMGCEVKRLRKQIAELENS